ncbi:MAG: undecaprenyldiphospho-muramoylpentapeptide beta-N-acetylglucosaminyltransferase [Bacillota bacterium]
MRKLRVIITGGGTGGHIYPALAIAKGLKESFDSTEILYVGTNKGLEADIVPKSGLAFTTVCVEGFTRPISVKTISSVFKALKGCWESLNVVRAYKPHVVVGTGGYVCGPVVLAAALLGIPTVIHEQNAIPGFTNRILSRFADRVCVTFEDSIKYFSKKEGIQLTGLPVRPEIISMDQKTGIQSLGLSEDKITVVITGGSRGARSINMGAEKVLCAFFNRKDIQVVHVTGHDGFDDTLSTMKKNGIVPGKGSNIIVVPYLYQIEHALAAADIIVGRAGASFLSEIMVRGIPSILIPYPYAANNHQEYNARSLVCHGAAKMILDKNLTGNILLKTLEEMIADVPLRKRMAGAAKEMGKINALNEIIDIIAGISTKR